MFRQRRSGRSTLVVKASAIAMIFAFATLGHGEAALTAGSDCEDSWHGCVDEEECKHGETCGEDPCLGTWDCIACAEKPDQRGQWCRVNGPD